MNSRTIEFGEETCSLAETPAPALKTFDMQVDAYLHGSSMIPLFVAGDSLLILKAFPDNCIDCCITSPPYWGHRRYANGGLGEEETHTDYVRSLVSIFVELQRVLKPTGSLWLNIGDSYQNKELMGIPWRVAFALTEAGWILRNSIIWNKVKGGPEPANDRLRNVHENVFHFVTTAKHYYYNADAIRSKPKTTKVVKGSVVSATGVSGIRYKRQIELSTELSDAEKKNAFNALDEILANVQAGKLADFRMIMRGVQRTTHSNSEKVSGRARELQQKGFYFLKYHPGGTKPSDVWDILPEDRQRHDTHFAPFPEDLCKIPILATCPPEGIVLDPFCGTGTAMRVAYQLQCRSIGIDLSTEYLDLARRQYDGFL